MNLNKAELSVWYDCLKDEKYRLISERIIELDELENLTEDEKIELSTLLRLEQKFLKSAEENVDNTKKIIFKLNHYKEKIKNDDRLLTLFLKKVRERIGSGVKTEISVIEDEYFKLMEKEFDVVGHDELNSEYEKILEEIGVGQILDDGDGIEACNNPKCLYCRAFTDEEVEFAYENLNKSGYLDNINEASMVDLMVTINRLEDELAQYTTLECDIEFDDEDEDDEDD